MTRNIQTAFNLTAVTFTGMPAGSVQTAAMDITNLIAIADGRIVIFDELCSVQ